MRMCPVEKQFCCCCECGFVRELAPYIAIIAIAAALLYFMFNGPEPVKRNAELVVTRYDYSEGNIHTNELIRCNIRVEGEK